MSGQFRPSRRAMLKVGLAGAATVASPAILRLTRRGAERPDQDRHAAGADRRAGLGRPADRSAAPSSTPSCRTPRAASLGRPIELLIEDTAGNPANCVRKAQEMVERHNCRLFTGITLSSEALAVVPKLAEWDSIFISADQRRRPADRRELRAELLPRQHLGADGHARGVALSADGQARRSSMRSGWTTPGATTAWLCSRTR